MLDLVLWTTSMFEQQAESGESGEDTGFSLRHQGPPSSILIPQHANGTKIKSPEAWNHRNPVLKHLFNIFYRLTESEFQTWSKKNEASLGDERRVAPPELYTLVPFLPDLFNENIRHTPNNRKVRAYIKYVYIYIFKKLTCDLGNIIQSYNYLC